MTLTLIRVRRALGEGKDNGVKILPWCFLTVSSKVKPLKFFILWQDTCFLCKSFFLSNFIVSLYGKLTYHSTIVVFLSGTVDYLSSAYFCLNSTILYFYHILLSIYRLSVSFSMFFMISLLMRFLHQFMKTSLGTVWQFFCWARCIVRIA